jgi:hypothetical protein
MSKKCERYVIGRGYISEGMPWTRTIREIIESGGRIVWKDEISRRIIFKIKPSKLVSLKSWLTNFSYEYNIICKNINNIFNRIRDNIRIISRGNNRIIAYAVLSGRYALLEVKSRTFLIKIGVRTSSSKPPSLLPPSAFTLDISDIYDVEKHYHEILEIVLGGVRNAGARSGLRN